MPRNEAFRDGINSMLSDVMFYMVPWRRARIQKIAADLINEKMAQLRKNFPRKFKKSKISLIGYSLGSVIVHDILSQQPDSLEFPGPLTLSFPVYSCYLLGSPLSTFLSLNLGENAPPPRLELPNKLEKFFNIFDPNDPIAFRQEPLFFGEPVSNCAPPVPLPTWKSPTGVIKKSGCTVAMDQSGGTIPPKRRIDFVIQRKTRILDRVKLEGVPLALKDGHFSYFTDRDVALFILRTLTNFNPASVVD